MSNLSGCYLKQVFEKATVKHKGDTFLAKLTFVVGGMSGMHCHGYTEAINFKEVLTSCSSPSNWRSIICNIFLDMNF